MKTMCNRVKPLMVILPLTVLLLSGCATYLPVTQNDRIPLFQFNFKSEKDVTQFVTCLADDMEAMMAPVSKIAKTRKEQQLPSGGSFKFRFVTKKARGHTADGKLVEGYVLTEHIDWGGIYRPKIQSAMRSAVLKKIATRARVVYVKEVSLDYLD